MRSQRTGLVHGAHALITPEGPVSRHSVVAPGSVEKDHVGKRPLPGVGGESVIETVGAVVSRVYVSLAVAPVLPTESVPRTSNV